MTSANLTDVNFENILINSIPFQCREEVGRLKVSSCFTPVNICFLSSLRMFANVETC